MSEQLIEFHFSKDAKPDCVKESEGFTWKPTMYCYPEGLSRAIEAETPSNDELLRLATKKTPPPSWFHENDDPFTK